MHTYYAVWWRERFLCTDSEADAMHDANRTLSAGVGRRLPDDAIASWCDPPTSSDNVYPLRGHCGA